MRVLQLSAIQGLDSELQKCIVPFAKRVQFSYAKSVDEVADDTLRQAQVVVACPRLLTDEVLARCEALQWVQSTWAGPEVLMQRKRKDYLLTRQARRRCLFHTVAPLPPVELRLVNGMWWLGGSFWRRNRGVRDHAGGDDDDASATTVTPQ